MNAEMFKLKRNSELPQFLTDNAKKAYLNFKINQALNNGHMTGLKKPQGQLATLFEISLTFENNTKLLRDDLFDQLADGPMLYDDKVVGWCCKDLADNCPKNITLHIFAMPTLDERELSIEKAFLSKEELTDDVARMLDAKPLSNATKNWKYYGKKLGIPDANLDLIERDGKNPAKELLLYVYHATDKEKKTAGGFRKITMEFEDRKDLHNLVNKDLNIKENDSRPLKEILPQDSEVMAKATFLLNDCNRTKNNWKQLARGWEISYEIYEQFDYELCPGPTQKLMEWVCTSNHQVSVQNLLDMLGGIKRNDIKEKLENIISKQINSPSSSRTTGNSM